MRWGASALGGSAADGAVCRFGRHGGGMDEYCMDIQYSALTGIAIGHFLQGGYPCVAYCRFDRLMPPSLPSTLHASAMACSLSGDLHAGWAIEKTELRCAKLNTTALPWLRRTCAVYPILPSFRTRCVIVPIFSALQKLRWC